MNNSDIKTDVVLYLRGDDLDPATVSNALGVMPTRAKGNRGQTTIFPSGNHRNCGLSPIFPNIFGYVGSAVQGYGMASYGNDTDLGSSVGDYLSSQSLVRNQQVTIIPTTPLQDALARAFIKNHPNKNDVGKLDNCAVRTNELLNAAGVPTNDVPFPGGTARDVQSIPGATTYYIPQGGPIPGPLLNAIPKYSGQ